MSNTINIDTITEYGARLPAGKYAARLIASEGKQSKKQKPMVQATFEVVKGDHTDEEVPSFYSLVVTEKSKKLPNGASETYRVCGGVTQMKRDFSAIGKPLPRGFDFPLDQDDAAKLLFNRFKGLLVNIEVTEQADSQDPAKKYTRVEVLGLANAAAVAEDDDDDITSVEDDDEA